MTVTDVITGSHGVVFDVRVLETFQTGDDPDGTQIVFGDELTDLGLNVGEVEYDATRTIRGTAFVRVPGTFGTDGDPSWPRGQQRLLAPFGNEVFIRYGIDLGESVLWTNMGYFGITDTHQDDAPTSPVELFCHDRSYVIEISELMNPRSFSPPQTVGDVFDDLVLDIFGDAVIIFDDATNTIPLASQIIAEKNRWKPLVELADSFGKIVYFDGEGQLRIETPPDPDEIVWELRSNRDGVLVEAQRELSREGVFNAVVVEGEKTGEADPVRGVAINADPNSPTRFGGPIGKVPTFLTTPLVGTENQAQNAARFLLQRALGAPYTVATESIVNPALRPYEGVRVHQSNNERDRFLADRVRIPLDEDAGMNIDMREKVQVVVGFGE